MEHIKINTDKLERLKVFTYICKLDCPIKAKGYMYELEPCKSCKDRKKARIKIVKEKGIHSPLHLIAKETSEYFQEPKLFARYLGFIKHLGIQEARKRLAEQKESKIREAKYFFKKYK